MIIYSSDGYVVTEQQVGKSIQKLRWGMINPRNKDMSESNLKEMFYIINTYNSDIHDSAKIKLFNHYKELYSFITSEHYKFKNNNGSFNVGLFVDELSNKIKDGLLSYFKTENLVNFNSLFSDSNFNIVKPLQSVVIISDQMKFLLPIWSLLQHLFINVDKRFLIRVIGKTKIPSERGYNYLNDKIKEYVYKHHPKNELLKPTLSLRKRLFKQIENIKGELFLNVLPYIVVNKKTTSELDKVHSIVIVESIAGIYQELYH